MQIGAGNAWASGGAGYYHTVATRVDGTLWTWGYNNNSQLGDGSLTQRTSPAQVGTAAGWRSAFQSSHGYYTLVTTSDGSLWGCGQHYRSGLGYAGRNPWVPDLVLPAL